MRARAPRRRILAWPVAFLTALALMLQVVAGPVASPAATDGTLALAGICHAATGEDGGRAPQPLSGACERCLLCHAGIFSFAVPSPVSLPFAPAAVAVARAGPAADRARGLAWPAYASRAPPAIG